MWPALCGVYPVLSGSIIKGGDYMKIKYIVRGREFDFKRVGDYTAEITLFKCWECGGLLYGYRDRFNIVSICKSDIISIN